LGRLRLVVRLEPVHDVRLGVVSMCTEGAICSAAGMRSDHIACSTDPVHHADDTMGRTSLLPQKHTPRQAHGLEGRITRPLTLTSCFHMFIVSWNSCWFLCSSMLMTSKFSTFLLRSKSCRIFRRTIEGGTLRA
jgi:hypothetical protein